MYANVCMWEVRNAYVRSSEGQCTHTRYDQSEEKARTDLLGERKGSEALEAATDSEKVINCSKILDHPCGVNDVPMVLILCI